MGPSQTARRATHDRTRRHPVIRPDYLQLYKVKAGPDAKPADAPAPAPAAPPARTRATRAFLIVLIAAVGINFGAMLGLVGWGVLQALGVFGGPAIEKIQREHGASIAQIEASVEALNASVMGLSAHVNGAGEREDAANRRVAEIGDAVGVLRSGMNELRAAQAAAAAEEPWRTPVEELTANVAKLRGDMKGLRASIDEAKPRQPANLGARLERIEQALIQHKLLGPIRGAIEPERTAAAAPATDGHIISLPE
jgi:predicted lipid-binding transport protein (Tim44 family)